MKKAAGVLAVLLLAASALAFYANTQTADIFRLNPPFGFPAPTWSVTLINPNDGDNCSAPGTILSDPEPPTINTQSVYLCTIIPSDATHAKWRHVLVYGTAAASDLSNGTTGTGAVVLAAGPALSGTVTNATTGGGLELTNGSHLQVGTGGSQQTLQRDWGVKTPGFGTIAAQSCAEVTVTVGAVSVAGDHCLAIDSATGATPSFPASYTSPSCRYLGSNQATVRTCNITGAGVADPGVTVRLLEWGNT